MGNCGSKAGQALPFSPEVEELLGALEGAGLNAGHRRRVARRLVEEGATISALRELREQGRLEGWVAERVSKGLPEPVRAQLRKVLLAGSTAASLDEVLQVSGRAGGASPGRGGRGGKAPEEGADPRRACPDVSRREPASTGSTPWWRAWPPRTRTWTGCGSCTSPASWSSG